MKSIEVKAYAKLNLCLDVLGTMPGGWHEMKMVMQSCSLCDDIRIELRQPDEIKEKFYAEPMALPEVKCYNPAFDVTDNSLITAIVTEKGICRAPYTESLRRLFEND